MVRGSRALEGVSRPGRRVLAGILIAACLSAGPVAWSTGTEDVAQADREIDALLALSVSPGVTLDRFASRFALGKGQLVEGGFSLARRVAYPALDPATVTMQATLALRPGSEDHVVLASFILADRDPAACISARAFADRHGLVAAAPLHPTSLTPELSESTTYTAKVEQAQVSATSRPHSHCLHELFVWHRDAE